MPSAKCTSSFKKKEAKKLEKCTSQSDRDVDYCITI